MNRTTFLALAAIFGFIASSCEQHPASELEGEHGSKSEGTEKIGESQAPRADAPKAPTETPTNPAGSGPAQPANDKGQPLRPVPPAQ